MAVGPVVKAGGERRAGPARPASLFAVYQPIVELRTRQTVGYEALARSGSGGFPAERFAASRPQGTISELDWEARVAAVSGALAAGLPPELRLFVNVEAETLGDPRPDWAAAASERARRELNVVLEITERALTSRPAQLLQAVAAARGYGWGIAIDDVGADTRSLALMPFLRPDVIKLDLGLVQERPTREIAQIVHAVRAESERTGAVLLAEGIETAEHLELAFGLGATLGQGYLFGRPGPLPSRPRALADPISFLPALPPTPDTPFALIAAKLKTLVAQKPLLIEMSKQLEESAAALGPTCVILSAFQDRSFFTRRTRLRYEGLGRNAALVAALGTGIEREPAPGVAGRTLAPDDALRGEWTVAVVAPHFAACLSALDRGDSGPDNQRTFDYVLTFDRGLVLGAARSLLLRV